MLTDSWLPLISTSDAKVADIILKLNSKKAHGYDNISIAPAVAKHFEGAFPNLWKFVYPKKTTGR